MRAENINQHMLYVTTASITATLVAYYKLYQNSMGISWDMNWLGLSLTFNTLTSVDALCKEITRQRLQPQLNRTTDEEIFINQFYWKTNSTLNAFGLLLLIVKGIDYPINWLGKIYLALSVFLFFKAYILENNFFSPSFSSR